MLIKKKLKDITVEEYKNWEDDEKYYKCGCSGGCDGCPFHRVKCDSCDNSCWIYNKDLYSDTFLNQEIEIEKDILTKKEKEYLSNIIEPFRDRVISIEKRVDRMDAETEFIVLEINSISAYVPREYIEFPYFKAGTMYQNMEEQQKYTLEDLGL